MIGMTEYIIVGDTEKYGTCLIYTCGTNKEHAEKVLERMLNNPDAEDKRVMETHSNIRINDVAEKDQWWNDPFLAN